MPKRIHLNAFAMNCVSHIQHGLWTRADTRQLEFNRLEPWIDLSQLLEKGAFDALFLADVIGTYDNYRGGRETAVREALQIPANDPMLLIPAMAHATEHLGFAFTSSVLQAHPFTFARQVSTLDHLTRGRVAWNIVTSYLSNAGTNLGFGGLPSHDERYRRAEEYLEVSYKLWEGSWEEDAVLRDTARGVYADPAKIHAIDHAGEFYEVAGPHLSEPSPQRTPLLFQAGSSSRGRDFAATHAECVFMFASMRSLRASTGVVGDIRARAARLGRRPDDILFFQGVTPVVGGTEAEAKAKEADFLAQSSVEAGLAHMSGSVGVDLGTIDLDVPLESLETEAIQGVVKGLIDSAPDKSWTFRDLARSRASGQFLTGTPEQIADTFEAWHEAGVDGFNIVYAVTPGTFADFIDGVVPELRRRGLVQSAYAAGTLREKLFGASRLSERHPAAGYRRQQLGN
jgi:FMN-dependent oxidoreductase (nitrilotriacetate monooxygenase family)